MVKAHGTAVGLPTDDDMGNSEVCPQPLNGRVRVRVCGLGPELNCRSHVLGRQHRHCTA